MKATNQLTFAGKVITILGRPIEPFGALAMVVSLLFAALFYQASENAKMLQKQIAEVNRSLVRLESGVAR